MSMELSSEITADLPSTNVGAAGVGSLLGTRALVVFLSRSNNTTEE